MNYLEEIYQNGSKIYLNFNQINFQGSLKPLRDFTLAERCCCVSWVINYDINISLHIFLYVYLKWKLTISGEVYYWNRLGNIKKYWKILGESKINRKGSLVPCPLPVAFSIPHCIIYRVRCGSKKIVE